jgi:hypothetical protein
VLLLCQIFDRIAVGSRAVLRTVAVVELKTLFGLPAHPLLVHVPIVLIPLVGVGAVAIVAVPAWRQRFGWVLAALSGIALLGVQLAIGSGETLEDHVERSSYLHRHTEMASSLRPLALVLFILTLAFVAIDRYRRRPEDARADLARKTTPFVAALLVLSAFASTVRLAQVGHNGAKASWHEVNMSSAGEHGEGGEGGEHD